MMFLVLSLLSSSAIFLLFKKFNNWNVDTFKAIVINYFTAVLFGAILLSGSFDQNLFANKQIIVNGSLLGFLFIGLFYLMAKISQEMGAGISSVATKLSLVLPSLFFMFTDPADGWSWYKITALIVAMPGIYFTVKSDNKGKFALLLPLMLFLGSGLLDIVLAYTDQAFCKTNQDKVLLTIVPFCTSGILGSLILFFRKDRKTKTSKTTLLAGMSLGLINFASIFFLLKTFEKMDYLDKSQIIPINNLGIVILSSLGAYLLMQEKLSRINRIGLFISLVSIVILLVDSWV